MVYLDTAKLFSPIYVEGLESIIELNLLVTICQS